MQLLLLGEIDRLLRPQRIRYWLRGGWALDFILGRVTRSHGDIDLVSWKLHEGRIRRLLESQGFVATPRGASMDFDKHGQNVNVLFLVRGRGFVYTAGYTDSPRWAIEVMADRPRELEGLSCRTISAQGLLEEKEKTPGWLGRPARQKDIESMEILRRLVAEGSAAITSSRSPGNQEARARADGGNGPVTRLRTP